MSFLGIKIHSHAHTTSHYLTDLDVGVLTMQVKPISTVPEAQVCRQTLLHLSPNNFDSTTNQKQFYICTFETLNCHTITILKLKMIIYSLSYTISIFIKLN